MKITFFELSPAEKQWVKKQYPKLSAVFQKGHIALDNLPKPDTEIISIHTGCIISTELLAKLPNLKLIVTRTAGLDHIDLTTCKQKGIVVANCPGLNAIAVAEFVFALYLNFIRQIPTSLEAGKRLDFEGADYVGTEIFGKTIGVIGTGAIGANVARIAKGFGMNILGFDYKKNQQLSRKYGLRYLGLKQLFQKSDIITLHVPATPMTEKMLNRTLLSYAKPGAVIINTARGSIVEPTALIQALKKGKLKGYLADVLDHELQMHRHGGKMNHKLATMVKAQRELVKLPNVYITPHMAYASQEASQRILEHSLDNIVKFSRGKKISCVI